MDARLQTKVFTWFSTPNEGVKEHSYANAGGHVRLECNLVYLYTMRTRSLRDYAGAVDVLRDMPDVGQPHAGTGLA